MKAIPKIGTRIKFTRSDDQSQFVCGIVTRIWCSEVERDENNEPYNTPDKVTVKVDAIPGWWMWGNTDLFCPDVSEVEPI